VNPLFQLVRLSESEKRERGLLYTPREIAQQPATWQITHRIFEKARGELKSFLARPKAELWTVYLVGAGSSDYIGRGLENLLRKCWRCEVSTVASTDLLTNLEDFVIPGRDYVWISFSRSGDSPEGVSVLEQALAVYPRVRHLVVSCNESGRMVELARNSDKAVAMVLHDLVNDRSLAMTSAFTNMMIFGQALAHLWEGDEFSQTLALMTQAANYLLEEGASLAYELSQQGFRRACFVGAGGLAATAHESALKLLELTGGGILTTYETTLGLRHGPMSALNADTLFTAFISTGATRRRYDGDLLHEIRSKQVVHTVVGVGAIDAASDYTLHCDAFDKVADDYRPAIDIIFSQMLGLFSSIELGLQPDSPSPSGLINRVVEKFTIYV